MPSEEIKVETAEIAGPKKVIPPGIKFRKKDLIEIYQDKEEKALREGPLFGLVCGEATLEEYEENELRVGRRAERIFYKCISEDDILFVDEEYMTLAQRHEKDADGNLVITGNLGEEEIPKGVPTELPDEEVANK